MAIDPLVEFLDTELLFSESSSPEASMMAPETLRTDEPWKIAIVDDDMDVHAVSRLVLSGFRFKGRPVKIFDEYSGINARRLFREEPGIAVILLDVVMETEHAGLDVVKYIREELDNSMVRIILRTGQPGEAPEDLVISEYDTTTTRKSQT